MRRPGLAFAQASSSGTERGGSLTRRPSQTNTICARRHGEAMPSTGTVKSTTLERTFVVSTRA